MGEPIVLETSQVHATITNNGICPTLTASMGIGGGYIPMVVELKKVYSVDMGGGKSQCIVIEDKSPTLTCTHYGEPVVCYEQDENADREKVL